MRGLREHHGCEEATAAPADGSHYLIYKYVPSAHNSSSPPRCDNFHPCRKHDCYACEWWRGRILAADARYNIERLPAHRKSHLWLLTLTSPQQSTPEATLAYLKRHWTDFNGDNRWWRKAVVGGIAAYDFGDYLDNPHIHLIVESESLGELTTYDFDDAAPHTESTLAGEWYKASQGGGVDIRKVGDSEADRRNVINYVARKGGATINPDLLSDYSRLTQGVRYRTWRLGSWRSRAAWKPRPKPQRPTSGTKETHDSTDAIDPSWAGLVDITTSTGEKWENETDAQPNDSRPHKATSHGNLESYQYAQDARIGASNYLQQTTTTGASTPFFVRGKPSQCGIGSAASNTRAGTLPYVRHPDETVTEAKSISYGRGRLITTFTHGRRRTTRPPNHGYISTAASLEPP